MHARRLRKQKPLIDRDQHLPHDAGAVFGSFALRPATGRWASIFHIRESPTTMSHLFLAYRASRRRHAARTSRKCIDFNAGVVYVDGQALDEPYAFKPTYLSLRRIRPCRLSVTVPEGELFVMGDNRNHSEDSRFSDVGCAPRKRLFWEGLLFVKAPDGRRMNTGP